MHIVRFHPTIYMKHRRHTRSWENISTQFIVTFKFSAIDPELDIILHYMNHFIFGERPKHDTMQKLVFAYHKNLTQLNQIVCCWKVGNINMDEEENQHKIEIKENIG